MRSIEEIRELRDELSKITDFITDFGTDEEGEDEDVIFSNNAADTLDWVLGEVPTDSLKSNAYLDFSNLKRIVDEIERRTGNKLEDYE